MADILDRLEGAPAGRYRIERELGSGGAAIVCPAQDLKHDRQVVLGVVRHELSATLCREGFRREIGIADRPLTRFLGPLRSALADHRGVRE